MKKLSVICIILTLFWVGCEDSTEPEIIIEDDPIDSFRDIFTDPAGDVRLDPVLDTVIGASPDALNLQGKQTSTHILFRMFYAEDVRMDLAGILLSLDTDLDSLTGTSQFMDQFPRQYRDGWDIGPDYDVIAILPSSHWERFFPEYPPLTLVIYDNASDTFKELTNAVSADSNMIEFAVPLSDLGTTDGNMDIIGYAYHSSFAGAGLSLDYIPNTGHAVWRP